MIGVETISAIAPGWFIIAALALLAIALAWVFYEGQEQEEQLDRMIEEDYEPKTVQVWTTLYDWEHEREGGVR